MAGRRAGPRTQGHSGEWLPAPFRRRGAARTRIEAAGVHTSRVDGRSRFLSRRSLAFRVRVARDGTSPESAKREILANTAKSLARREGFEPPTLRFEVRKGPRK